MNELEKEIEQMEDTQFRLEQEVVIAKEKLRAAQKVAATHQRVLDDKRKKLIVAGQITAFN